MITTKQRAKLRALANPLDTILQIGKNGIIDTTLAQVESALAARELIKLRVLETSPLDARSAAQQLAERCHAEIVQVIGTRFVLYRCNPKVESVYDEIFAPGQKKPKVILKNRVEKKNAKKRVRFKKKK